MKSLIQTFVLLGIMFLTLSSCQTETKKEVKKENEAKITAVKPARLEMKEDSLVIKAQKKAMMKVLKAKENMADEAVMAVLETRNVVRTLNDKNAAGALKKLENIKKNIEATTRRFPDLKLLPVDITIKTKDLVTDVALVKLIVKDVRAALDDGKLQIARKLLEDVASEVDITTVNIPLATYPVAIDDAIGLIKDKKIEEARYILLREMDKMVIKKDVLPLPFLRAEVLIDEAMTRHLENRKANKAVVVNLLENAEYQLEFANVLGYGGKDKMYKELNRDINEIKQSANADKDLENLLKSLKAKVNTFEESLF